MTPRPLLLLAASAVLALGVAACGEDDSGEEASSDEASVSFVSPADGAQTSDTVTAEIELENFELDPASVGKMAEDGHGHLHFSLDGGEFDFAKYSGANGKLAAQLGTDGQYSPSVAPEITYRNLPPGEHTLVVELANNDHSEPGVSDEVSFEVE